MPSRALVAIKPGSGHQPLLDMATDLMAAGSMVHLASLVPVGNQGDEPQRLEDAKQRLVDHASSLRSAGYEVDTHAYLNTFNAGAELARLASRYEVDLLIIGLGKRSRVGKALLGGDAQTVLLTAECPVVTMRIGET